ncbi:hypothetical protein [Yunchengibacter salinarum]|uniref:hypothetical protein n=1 Tax=Yunchengibacter salinarum TaxID=3133399 RepID=UPI0035B609B0
MISRFLAGFLLFMGLLMPSALAETTSVEIKIAVRTVSFLQSPPAGEQPVHIVFDPATPASQADADAIAAAMAGGMDAGNTTLVPKLTPLEQAGDVPDGGIVLIPQGTQAHHGAIAAATEGRMILSMSTDLACVRAGHCAVGIESTPKVKILVNRAVVLTEGIKFSSGFLLLVEQI